MTKTIKPFVGWAGGKSQLLPEIETEIKRAGQFDTYYEPFVGGGAVLFDLLPQKAVINDYNQELINAYRTIRDDLPDLLAELSKLHNSKDDFYKIRAWDREPDYANLSKAKKAARFIYLIKTCFNSLYRVNRKGYFNTPYGHKRTIQIVDQDNLTAISQYLNNNEIAITSGDFAKVLTQVKPNSLVYLDPPYVPLTATASFTSYTSVGFNKSDQECLAQSCQHLDRIGAKFIASNSDTELVHELYQEFNIRTVYAKRNINANGKKRGAVAEVLITNF